MAGHFRPSPPFKVNLFLLCCLSSPFIVVGPSSQYVPDFLPPVFRVCLTSDLSVAGTGAFFSRALLHGIQPIFFLVWIFIFIENQM